jgi:hypothetical protein
MTCGHSKKGPRTESLSAGPSERIKSPLLSCQISALYISLYRFVRDSAGSDAGLCRWMTGRSATYEQTASNHGHPALAVRGHGP